MTTKPAPAAVTAANLANYDSPWSVAAYGERAGGLFPAEAALIDEYFPSAPAAVLDLGCGAGRTTVALHEAGFRVTGIDLSPGQVAEARRLYPAIDIRLMDATALDFPDSSFDAAIFSFNGIDCLYPVAARERCFAEVHRVLRPGAVFLLSSHNAIGTIFSGGYFYPQGFRNAFSWLRRQRGNPYLREWYWWYDDPGGAQHLFSAPPSHTRRQAAKAGFDVLEVRGATGERHQGRIARREQHVHFVVRRR